MRRTRVKICGITREQDLAAAAHHGADAIGLVFYPPSPRYLAVDLAQQLAAAAPVLVSVVALFVNPSAAEVQAVVSRVRPHLLQFHGDEPAQF
jgi:phosphoribosylanthranilate isomerase